MKKIIGTYLVSCIVWAFVFLVGMENVHAMEADVKRRISLVYDDSGSMYIKNSLKWSRANYAVQVFCGLLGDRDDFYVTYMSDYKNPVKYDVNRISQRQETIQRIRKNIFYTKQTPFESVIEALKILEDDVSEEDNIEKWLVIMTDGIFFEEEKYNEMREQEEKINREIRNIINKEKESKNFRLMYIGIGEDALEVKEDKAMGIYSKIVRGEDISKGLQEAAGIISGKTIIRKSDFNIKDNIVEIENKFPLKNLILFYQNEDKEIVNIGQNEVDIDFSEEYKVKYANARFGDISDKTLVGSIVYLKNAVKGEFLPAGVIELEYNDTINKENLTCIYDPAMDIDFHIIKEGKIIKNEHFLKTGDSITIKMFLKESKTDNKIDLNLLPNNIEYMLNIKQGERRVSIKKNEYTCKLKEEKLEIEAMCDLENFFHLRKEKEYKVEKFSKFVIKRSEENKIWNASLSNLDVSGKEKFMLLYKDGRIPSNEVLKKVDFYVSTNENILFDIKKNDDNTFYIIPKYWYKRFMTSAGEVQVRIDGSYGNGEVIGMKANMSVEDISVVERYKEFLLLFLGILILLWYIIGIVKKPRFDKRRAYVEYVRTQYIAGMKQTGKPATLTFNTNFFSRWFIPYKAEKSELNGLTLKAGKRRSYVIIPVYAQHSNLRIDGIAIDDDGSKKPYRINSETLVEAIRGDTIESYKYKHSDI